MKSLVVRLLQNLPSPVSKLLYRYVWRVRQLSYSATRLHPARAFRLLSGSSKNGGPPKGIIEHEGKALAVDLKTPPLPAIVSKEVSFLYHKNRDVDFEQIEVLSIPSGRLYGSDGAAIRKDDLLIANTSYQIGRAWGGKTAWRHSIFTKFSLGEVQHYKGKYASICAPSSNTYFHWIFDVLPRICYLNSQEPEGWVVGVMKHDFQRDTLQSLGLENIIEVGEIDHFEFDELLCLSTTNLQGHVKQTVEFLNSSFPPSARLKERTKIFVDRKHANYRKLTHHKAICEVLCELGVKRVFPEELSFQEQVDLFSSAELVIAVHGSGLSNIVFCPEDVRILELFSAEYTNPIFYRLANLLGFKYDACIDSGDFEEKAQSENIICDVSVTAEQLKTKIEGLYE